MDRGSARIFLAIASRIVPEEGPATPGAHSSPMLETATAFLASQDAGVQAKLKALLRVFEWLAVLRHGKPFTRLAAEKQDAYLRSWETSRLQLFRFGFASVRNLVLVSFYTQAQSWPAIGYPGPVLEMKQK